MIRLLRVLTPWIILLILASAANAQNLIPLPEFTDHEIRETENPSARAAWREHLDLAALAVGLVLASYFALVKRSRRGLYLLAIASLIWLGFWRQGCVCPIGSIQNVVLALADPEYALPIGVVVLFALPLVFALFVGRTFCAGVCPLGALQELVAVRPIQVPVWLDQTLGLLAYVYLGAAVLFAAMGTAADPIFVICRYDPFVGFFRFGGSANMLLVGGCFLVVGLFVGRPYCRYLCPYGVLLGLLSKLSKWHVRIPPQECVQCRLCEDACPYGAIREPTVNQTAEERVRGRRRLARLIVLLPVLVGVGAWLGHGTGASLSRLDPVVRLADRILLEETGRAEGTSDASDAFRNTGRPIEELYREAFDKTRRFGVAGAWLGAWVGLVIGGKLIYLSVRRRREDYQPDRSNCVACGRCFWYCPNEQARLGLIKGLTPADTAP
ncbi:MAG: 4Fe-4S binding protein [Pirellulales bacterium]|nr:4Fe-4S binding protein [Pirellulales bacterium]